MTLPEDVQDAMDSADNDCGLDLTYMTRDEWHDIRAHLLSQEAEIASLQSGLAKHVNRVCELQSRLAAADALLRDLYARFDRINHDEDGDAYINESHYGMRNIEAYRKGNAGMQAEPSQPADSGRVMEVVYRRAIQSWIDNASLDFPARLLVTLEAALAAQGQPAERVPEGWMLVPIKPSPQMLDAAVYAQEPNMGANRGGSNSTNRLRRRAQRIYAAMLKVSMHEQEVALSSSGAAEGQTIWMEAGAETQPAQGRARAELDAHHAEIADMAKRLDAAESALHRIKQWSEAYPIKVFPEPDWKRAAAVLKDNGMTLDSISAHAMRHVIEGVQRIADAAAQEGEG